MKAIILPALALGLASGLAACTHSSGAERDALDGTWQLSEIGGEAASGTLHFDASERSYSGNAGCNTTFGQYELKGNDIRFTEPMSTLKGCDAQLMAQDRKLGQGFAQGTNWQLQGQTLEIRDAAGQVLIRATR